MQYMTNIINTPLTSNKTAHNKGIVHPKMTFLSTFIHPHVVPNLSSAEDDVFSILWKSIGPSSSLVTHIPQNNKKETQTGLENTRVIEFLDELWFI